MQVYIKGIDKTATCRQVVLDRYLNRQEKEQVVCKEREEKCNICKGADSKEEDKEIEEEESKGSKGGSSSKEDTDTVKAEQEEARQVFKQQQ